MEIESAADTQCDAVGLSISQTRDLNSGNVTVVCQSVKYL